MTYKPLNKGANRGLFILLRYKYPVYITSFGFTPLEPAKHGL